MRGNVSHWDRSTGDEHIGVVMLVVLAGAVIFGVVFFWQMSGAFRAPRVDVLGPSSEQLAQRRGSGYQPGSQPAAQPQAQAQTQQQAQAQTQQQAQAQPTARPTAQPTAAPQGVAHVAHTDGVGVVLRASPKDSDRLPRGFMDGAEVTVLERQGADWARVRGANGDEGWIPAKYLDQ